MEVKKITDPEDPASQPDDKQKRAYQMLGIEWESTLPTRETEFPDLRDCSAFGTTPQVLCGFPDGHEKLGRSLSDSDRRADPLHHSV